MLHISHCDDLYHNTVTHKSSTREKVIYLIRQQAGQQPDLYCGRVGGGLGGGVWPWNLIHLLESSKGGFWSKQL